MQSPSRSFLSANGDTPNLRAVMGAALDAYLWTERRRTGQCFFGHNHIHRAQLCNACFMSTCLLTRNASQKDVQ
eukprot:s326_g17.t1